MIVEQATDQNQWDNFLLKQRFSPFLQSWTMGEVYNAVGHKPLYLAIVEDNAIVGICLAIVVPARRGRHLAVQYGPVLSAQCDCQKALTELIKKLKQLAKEHQCTFIRMSPFWKINDPLVTDLEKIGAKPAPLHLLAEHVWYLPLTEPDSWVSPNPCPEQSRRAGSRLPAGQAGIPNPDYKQPTSTSINPEDTFKNLRQNHRNLTRRAEREGVQISRSKAPESDLSYFLALHEETRKRHHFTPYSNEFFKQQLLKFHAKGQATLYLAHYQNQVIATSIHMHLGGETSYHHGASTHKYPKIPASYLLQWTAIKDAIERGDKIYNFWGIAPEDAKSHPFKGVTTFKTGFGGKRLELVHCLDIPVNNRYYITYGIETLRRWRRGF